MTMYLTDNNYAGTFAESDTALRYWDDQKEGSKGEMCAMTLYHSQHTKKIDNQCTVRPSTGTCSLL